MSGEFEWLSVPCVLTRWLALTWGGCLFLYIMSVYSDPRKG